MRDYQQERIERLLRAMYDLADGEPGKWVDGHKAAEAADVREQFLEYEPMCKYLEGSGFITARGLIHHDWIELTSKGISAVEDGWPTTIVPEPPRQPPL